MAKKVLSTLRKTTYKKKSFNVSLSEVLSTDNELRISESGKLYVVAKGKVVNKFSVKATGTDICSYRPPMLPPTPPKPNIKVVKISSRKNA